MDAISSSITPRDLADRLWRPGAPLLIDVRRAAAVAARPLLIASALRRPPETVAAWAGMLPPGPVVVYCVHGHEVSQKAAAALRARGRDACFLEGGLEGWLGQELPTVRLRPPLGETPSLWVTRERPKIDRIACPWLIRRFLDPLAEILFVPSARVAEVAAATGGVPFDVPDVEFGHREERCSFDALLDLFGLAAPGLADLARIVRGADTARLDLAPEAAGLLAVSLGLSLVFADDREQLAHGLVLYDALWAWARGARAATHDRRPGGAHLQVDPR
jgi:rhodanese-related sulfurtransferase